MTGFMAVAVGTCLILAAIGAMVGFWMWLDARAKGASSGDDDFRQAIEARLGEIERRLTDTQDVMLALSEKVDRWDAHDRQAEAGTP